MKHCTPHPIPARCARRGATPVRCRPLLGLAAAAMLWLGGCAWFQPPPVDSGLAADVVARVNRQPITQAELDLAMQEITDLAQGRVNPDQIERLKPRIRKEALENLIDTTLVEQAIDQAGIHVIDEEVDRAVDDLNQYYTSIGGTMSGAMIRAGLTTETLRAEVRKQLRREKLIDDVMHIDKPSNEEMRQFYAEHPDRYTWPRAVYLRRIVIAFPTDTPVTDDERRQYLIQADTAYQRLLAGEDFANVARVTATLTPTLTPTAGLGEPTWINESAALPAEVLESAFELQPGEISPILNTMLGYYIIKVEDRRDERLPDFEEVSEIVRSDMMLVARTDADPKMIQKLREKAQIVYRD